MKKEVMEILIIELLKNVSNFSKKDILKYLD